MAKNTYTGEIPCKVGAVNGRMVFDYAALAAVNSSFKRDQLMDIMAMSITELVKIAAIGFQKLTPELDEDTIMKLSPPVTVLATAIDHALLHAYHGPEEAKQIIDEVKKINDVLKKSAAKKN